MPPSASVTLRQPTKSLSYQTVEPQNDGEYLHNLILDQEAHFIPKEITQE